MNAEVIQILAATFASVLTALGGWETIKYFINHKTNKRKAEAEADSVEFTVLKNAVEFLEQQLQEKEIRFSEQIDATRKLNAEVLELTKEKAKLELELQTYRCLRKKCTQREPPNGY